MPPPSPPLFRHYNKKQLRQSKAARARGGGEIGAALQQGAHPLETNPVTIEFRDLGLKLKKCGRFVLEGMTYVVNFDACLVLCLGTLTM